MKWLNYLLTDYKFWKTKINDIHSTENINERLNTLEKKINELDAKITQIINEITPIITSHANALNALLGAKSTSAI